MTTDMMRHFLAVYDSHNITKSSEQLHISQQGLSASICRLEKELGVPLFTRTKKGTAPTKYAEYLYEKIKSLVDEYDDMSRELSSFKEAETAKLVIALSYGSMPYAPYQLFSDFMKANPHIKVQFADYTDNICEDLVLNGEADIAFCPGPIQDDIFKARLIATQDFYLLANTGSPLAKKARLTLKDLDSIDLACVGKEFKSYWSLMDACQQDNIMPNIVFTSSEVINLDKPVMSGACYAMAINNIAKTNRNPAITAIPIDDDRLTWKLYMIVRKCDADNSAIAAFWEYYFARMRDKK